MAQLRQDYPRFVGLDTEVIVVGPDDANDFKRYWSENELLFTGVPDPGLLKKLGQEFNLIKLGRVPAQILLDKAGMVRMVHYSASMSDISPNAEVLALIEQLNSEIDPVSPPS